MHNAIGAINLRYSDLAEQDCCLSCGGAVELAVPRPGEVCVDLGSGRGHDVLRLADEVGPTGFAWGIDVSDGMIRASRRMADKLGVRNATFAQAELDKLPLESGSVDLVISNCTLNHVADKHAVWSEIFRVLRPGGRFVVSDIYATEEVPARFRDDPEAVAECWAGAVTREIYLDTVATVGFDRVEVREESAPYPKGAIEVVSLTLAGTRPEAKKGCGCACGTGQADA